MSLVALVILATVRSFFVRQARAAYAKELQDYSPVHSRLVLEFSDELRESSGVAKSGLAEGVFWTHNDSGDRARLFAFDGAEVLFEARLEGADARDWEAMDVGPCPWELLRSCVWVGDVGDNAGVRSHVTLYVFAEEAVGDPGAATVVVVPEHAGDEAPGWRRLDFTYPGGARDVEALAVDPSGDVVMVSKGREGTLGVYRMPAAAVVSGFSASEPVESESAGTLPVEPRWTVGRVVSGGGWAPNGDLVVRTYTEILRFARVAGGWSQVGTPCFVGRLGMGGEALTVVGDSTYMLTREAGGGRSAGADEVVCSHNRQAAPGQ